MALVAMVSVASNLSEEHMGRKKKQPADHKLDVFITHTKKIHSGGNRSGGKMHPFTVSRR